MLARLKHLVLAPSAWLYLLAGLTVARLITAGTMPLVPDEAYYWLWAQHPDFGYYDHPPMVAWWIAVSTALFDHPFWVRVPFVLSFLAVSWLMWDASRLLFGDVVARRTVLWLNACVLVSVGTVLATPDPPSVMMWAGGVWAMARLVSTNKGLWWLVFGLFAGLGVEAKYTNLFLGLGVVAWMILDGPARRWLLTPWPYVGAVIALLAMAPNLLWNLHHDWATIEKQFGRIGPRNVTLRFLIEALITQPLLLNPLIFGFVVVGARQALRTSESRLRLLIALPLPLVLYLGLHVFHDRIQGNWTAPIVPGLVLLAAAAAQSVRHPVLLRLRGLVAPLGMGLSLLILAWLAISPRLHGSGGLSEGWPELARQISQRSGGVTWIATTDYNTHAELSFYGKPLFYNAVIAVAERRRYPWQGALPTTSALIVVAADKTYDLSRCFTDLSDLGTVSRTPKPGKKTQFRLYRGTSKAQDCDLDP